MIGIGVVGCGYWGPNLVRNFASQGDCEVRVACDRDPARVAAVRKHFPFLRSATDVRELLEAPDVDAVVICTPLETHYPLASAALAAGKHVLVEKPLCGSVETAHVLVEQAERSGLVLQVDHTYLYGGAVRKVREIVERGDLGQLLYVDCVRVNLGLFQQDTNVVWDLAPHDVSIILHLVDQQPVTVTAIGAHHFGKVESQAYIALRFADGLIAHMHVNWLAPVKVRSTLIGGSRRMIVYDDIEPSEKIRVYDKGVTFSDDAHTRAEALVDYRMGDMFAPYLDKTEPLARMCGAFLTAIRTGRPSLSTGRHGVAVVRVLEAAQQSIRKNGEPVALSSVS